jgi:hypothetical protein
VDDRSFPVHRRDVRETAGELLGVLADDSGMVRVDVGAVGGG